MSIEAPGWSPADQLAALFDLVCSVSGLPGDVVEVGSWCGRSASALGYAAQAASGTSVHCIDLFPEREDWRQNGDGTYSFEVSIDGVVYRGCHHQTVWCDVFEREIEPVYSQYGSVRHAFELQVQRSGLEGIVRPFRGDSTAFVSTMPNELQCKLAFIDGEHSYEEVCNDIRNLDRLLIRGGWLCFDDAFSVYRGVDQAVEELVIGSDLYGLCRQLTRKLFVAQKIRAGRLPVSPRGVDSKGGR